MGSGSTMSACKRLNRKYIGFEIDEKWFKVAQDRLNGYDQNGQYDLLNDCQWEQGNLFDEEDKQKIYTILCYNIHIGELTQ